MCLHLAAYEKVHGHDMCYRTREWLRASGAAGDSMGRGQSGGRGGVSEERGRMSTAEQGGLRVG